MVHIIHPMGIHHVSLATLDISVRTILRVSRRSRNPPHVLRHLFCGSWLLEDKTLAKLKTLRRSSPVIF